MEKYARTLLLRCTTPDAVARLSKVNLDEEKKQDIKDYYLNKHPKSLQDLVDLLRNSKGAVDQIQSVSDDKTLFQVTSHSPMLSSKARKDLAEALFKNKKCIEHMALDQIKTMDQFKNKLKLFFKRFQRGDAHLLLIEYHVRSVSEATFIDCVRYCILNEITDFQRQLLPSKSSDEKKLLIGLILHVPRQRQGGSIPLPGQPWQSYHIDELTGDSMNFNSVSVFLENKVSKVFENEQVLLALLMTEAAPKAISKMGKPASQAQGQSRIQTRLDILLENIGDDSLILVLSALVVASLKEQEQELDETEPDTWLAEIATSSVYIKDGHTFSKTIRYHLEDVVAEHLKKALEILDTHDGLNHAVDDKSAWAKELFYTLAIQHSKQLQSSWRSNVSRTNFAAEFPFSWAVIETLDRYFALNQTNPGAGGDLLHSAFDSEPFARPLNDICFEYADAREAFVKDLIMLKKKPHISTQDSDELKPLVDAILQKAARDTRLSETESSDSHRLTISNIYRAFRTVEPQVDVVFQAVSLSGSSLGEALNHSQPDGEEFLLHQVAVLHSLTKLKPKDNLNQEDFKIWQANCATTGQLIQNSCIRHGDEDLYARIKVLWKRVKIVSLFLDLIWNQEFEGTREKKEEVKRSVSGKAPNLWLALGDCEGLFEKVLEFLQTTSQDVAFDVYNFKNLDVCIVCKKAIKQPVALTCSHVGCRSCIQKLDDGDPIECPEPECGEIMDDDFQVQSSVQCSEALMEHKSFRQGITSCFQEILQEYVFKRRESELPSTDVCKMLLDCVFYKNAKDERTRTKDLSPFPCDSIDRHPRVRSFIVQLILQTDFENGMEFLDAVFIDQVKTLKETSTDERMELSLLLLTCIEDHLRFDETLMSDERSSLDAWISKERNQSKVSRDFYKNNTEDVSPAMIAGLAWMRLASEKVAEIIGSTLQNGGSLTESAEAIIRGTMDGMEDDENELMESIRNYLVRVLVSRYSHDYVFLWRSNKQLNSLLPSSIRDADQSGTQDFFLALEVDFPAYKDLRDGLRNILLFNKNGDDLKKAIVTDRKLKGTWQLACYFAYFLDGSNNGGGNYRFIENARQGGWLRDDLLEVTRSAVSSTEFWQQFPEQRKAVKTLVMHLKTVLDCDTNETLRTLSAFVSGALGKTFLPTIPQDETFEIAAMLRQVLVDRGEDQITDTNRFYGDGDTIRKLYKCRCGNMFGIADCGKPFSLGKCSHCGKTIGGQSHQLIEGSGQSEMDQLEDRSAKGHNLVLESEKSSPAMGVRVLTGLEVAILRFILHAAMFLGCHLHVSFIKEVMGRIDDPEQDLIGLMSANFRQISQSLGKSEEFAQLLLHNVISGMSRQPGEVNRSILNSRWSSKDEVKQWETEFAKAFIKPSCAILDQQMEQFKQTIRNDAGMACQPLLDILDGQQERDPSDQDHDPDIPCQILKPQFWHPRENWINTASIRHKIGDEELQKKCPNLDRVLKRQKELTAMVDLPEILDLQYLLVERFNYCLDIADLKDTTVAKFLDKHFPGNDRMKNMAEKFLRLVQKLKSDGWLDDAGMARVFDEKQFSPDLEVVKCSILFPSDHELGPIAKGVVERLVQVHNDMMSTYGSGKDTTIPEIHPADIKDANQLIHYNETALNRLIQTNSEYEFELSGKGRPINWKLDKERLEATLIHRWVVSCYCACLFLFYVSAYIVNPNVRV